MLYDLVQLYRQLLCLFDTALHGTALSINQNQRLYIRNTAIHNIAVGVGIPILVCVSVCSEALSTRP